MKTINNCIFENNKNMNEIIKKGLLNKEKKNNLLIQLNEIEKNIINNIKFYGDLIDNFIEKQNQINNRNKIDIKYAKNIGNFNNNDDIIEKLYNIEDEIDEINNKLNTIKDKMIKETIKIKNKQLELIEFEKKINNEIDDFKIFIDEKINDYKRDNSYKSDLNLIS